MFTYLLERIAILERTLRDKKVIDMSEKDKELEDVYEKFVLAMNSIKK
jgi:serine O-acetyltransferase